MRNILLPTAYLPPIHWFAFAIQSQSFKIEVHETYPKQTIRNHCNIATSTGMLRLTVPVTKPFGNHTQTIDIKIDNTKKWQQIHWRSIVSAYNNSAYFLYYRDLFENIYTKKYDGLVDLNHDFALTLLNALQVKTISINYTEHFELNPREIDLRILNQPTEGIIDEMPKYMQVFENNYAFIPKLSIIDLLFNLGPDSLSYLKKINLSVPLPTNRL